MATLSVYSADIPPTTIGQVVRRAGRGAQRAQLLVQERRPAASGSAAPWSPGRGTSCWPSRRPWPAPGTRSSGRGPGALYSSTWAGRLVPVLRSSQNDGRRHLRVAQVQLVVGLEDARARWPPRRRRRSARSRCACRRRSRCRCPGTSAAPRRPTRRRCAAGRWPRTGRWARPPDRRRSTAAGPGARAAAGAGCRCTASRTSAVRVAGVTSRKVRPAASTDRRRGQVQRAVLGLVRAERQHVGVVELGHARTLPSRRQSDRPATGPTPDGGADGTGAGSQPTARPGGPPVKRWRHRPPSAV